MKKTLLTFTVALVTGSASLNAQVTNGLVAKWSFNSGNANDEVGTNNGTVYGATLTTDRFGNANMAYEFDGVSHYLDFGNSSTIKPTVGSISLWVKMISISNTGSSTFNPILFTKSSTTNSNLLSGYHFTVLKNNSKAAIFIDDVPNSSSVFVYSTNAISTSTWTHYLISYDSDSLALYTNGQLQGKVYKGFTNTYSSTSPVVLATLQEGTLSEYFNGAIDDIRIYNRVLDQLEVDSLFNESDPITLGLSDNSSTNNSIGIYPNPTKNLINFTIQANVQMTSVTGQIIAEIKNVNTLDISNYPTGIYFLTFIDTNRQVVQRSKISKE